VVFFLRFLNLDFKNFHVRKCLAPIKPHAVSMYTEACFKLHDRRFSAISSLQPSWPAVHVQEEFRQHYQRFHQAQEINKFI
jgi:cell division protein FtsI/penicillin-binding protein 2